MVIFFKQKGWRSSTSDHRLNLWIFKLNYSVSVGRTVQKFTLAKCLYNVDLENEPNLQLSPFFNNSISRTLVDADFELNTFEVSNFFNSQNSISLVFFWLVEAVDLRLEELPPQKSWKFTIYSFTLHSNAWIPKFGFRSLQWLRPHSIGSSRGSLNFRLWSPDRLLIQFRVK